MATHDLDTCALVALVSSHLGKKFHLPYDNGPHFTGGEYDIYMLTDETKDQRVAARIPKSPLRGFTIWSLKAETDIRRRIEGALLCRFQPLLACDLSSNNLIRHPFMLLGWADGSSLKWSEDTPKCQTKRQRILHAIANTCLDLLRIHQPGANALNWITGKIDRKITRAKEGTFPHGTLSECEKQKSLTATYWMPEMNDAPHVLVHGDLSSNNIIVDENLEVTSVIDLGWAEMVPLQYAVGYPRFISHEPIKTDSGFSWLHRGDTQLHKDRLYYLACIKERAEREGGLALSYYHILSRPDEINRHWWFTAASRADIHKAMAVCDWDPASVIARERRSLG